MDHNKRAALLTAIDVGNLTRAAEQLGYTQSGLSYIIKSLETEFGFPLLIRSRSGVRPTADCTRILPLLRELHHKSQMLEQEVADIRGLAVGNVSVGVFPCISRFWMPNILRDFTARYPGITSVDHDTHRQTVKNLCCPLNNIQVADGDRVKAAGINGLFHRIASYQFFLYSVNRI